MHSLQKCGTNTTHLTQMVQLLLFFTLTGRLLQCLHPACMCTLPKPSQSIFRVLLYRLKFFQFKQPTKCMSQPSVVHIRLYTNCRNKKVHQRCHNVLTMKEKNTREFVECFPQHTSHILSLTANIAHLFRLFSVEMYAGMTSHAGTQDKFPSSYHTPQ